MKRLERENSWIGILDCNNFYASCERVFRPDLKGKPVAILSNNDGCIIARSQEVKALGIPNAVPIHQIAHLIKQHQIQVLSSNYELYADMHRRIMQTLQRFFSGVEVYSIDEAFLDFFPINDAEEAEAFAKAIHAKYPGKMLAYNCSPSFNWASKLSNQQMLEYREKLAALGYKFQFITLAGFHALNTSMFELARAYKEQGMLGYSQLQQKEFALQSEGFTAVKHQAFVGTGYFDAVQNTVTAGQSSTVALKGSTEEEQF